MKKKPEFKTYSVDDLINPKSPPPPNQTQISS